MLASACPTIRPDANCDYQKAPFFNVLAAYWIQFMTHDWFSHMDDGHNAPGTMMEVGCKTELVNSVQTPLTPEEIAEAGLPPRRPGRQGLRAERLALRTTFTADGKTYLTRAPKTFANNNTAWWDASQLYGFDETSVQAREARSARSSEDAAGAGGGHAGRVSARAAAGRSRAAAVGGPGVGRVSR